MNERARFLFERARSFFAAKTLPVTCLHSEVKLCIWLDFDPSISYIA